MRFVLLLSLEYQHWKDEEDPPSFSAESAKFKRSPCSGKDIYRDELIGRINLMPGTSGRQVQDLFKDAMRHLAQSVAIVTTSKDSEPWGITVTSYASVSIDPPLMLVCVSKAAEIHDVLVGSDRFVVNLLAEDQSAESDRCAGRDVQEKDKFQEIAYENSNAGPLIHDSIAWLECERWATYDGGDHTILIGLVYQVKTNRDAPPLLYFDRKYTALTQR